MVPMAEGGVKLEMSGGVAAKTRDMLFWLLAATLKHQQEIRLHLDHEGYGHVDVFIKILSIYLSGIYAVRHRGVPAF